MYVEPRSIKEIVEDRKTEKKCHAEFFKFCNFGIETIKKEILFDVVN